MIIEKSYFYAISFEREDGSMILARGSQPGPALFYKRTQAVKFRDELKNYLKAKGRVIKIEGLFKWMKDCGAKR